MKSRLLQESGHNIIAPITPSGIGGVSIIRVSGEESRQIVSKIVRKNIDDVETHRAVLRSIVDTDGNINDIALILPMDAPTSFTGENVVEIHLHGSVLIRERVQNMLLSTGMCRMARPGEFSFRAFLNGRVSLMQAEAINDAICAKSLSNVFGSMDVLHGKYNTEIIRCSEKLTSIIARLEAMLDYPDDVGEADSVAVLTDLYDVQECLSRLEGLFSIRRDDSEHQIAIVGEPNVGKSSLLNAILGKNRAIVSEVAGTTRDIVSAGLNINGIRCEILDTAGIRDTVDLIEQDGIARVWETLNTASIVLLVLDGSKRESLSEYAKLYNQCKSCTKATPIVVFNKIDVGEHILEQAQELKTLFPKVLFCSAEQNLNITEIITTISEYVKADEDACVEKLTNSRHLSEISMSLGHLKSCISGCESCLGEELVLIDLRNALSCLGRLLGLEFDESILDTIFSTFCVGK